MLLADDLLLHHLISDICFEDFQNNIGYRRKVIVLMPTWSDDGTRSAHPDDTCGRVLQPRWRTGSPWLLDRCNEEAGREEQSSLTFDLQ